MIGKSSKTSVVKATAATAAKAPNTNKNANVSPPLCRSTSESPEKIFKPVMKLISAPPGPATCNGN